MTDNPLILAVDRNTRNLELLAEFFRREGYQILKASTIEALDEALNNWDEIALAVVDISGFDSSIWERCSQLRDAYGGQSHRNIPFLILSSKQTQALQQQSVVHGALSLLVKPLVVKQLLAMIKNLL